MKRDNKYVIKQLRKMQAEPPTSLDPTMPYKRTIVKTKQWWPLELIRQGKTKVLFQYLGIWAVILILIAASLYFLIMWIWGILGW